MLGRVVLNMDFGVSAHGVTCVNVVATQRTVLRFTSNYDRIYVFSLADSVRHCRARWWHWSKDITESGPGRVSRAVCRDLDSDSVCAAGTGWITVL